MTSLFSLRQENHLPAGLFEVTLLRKWISSVLLTPQQPYAPHDIYLRLPWTCFQVYSFRSIAANTGAVVDIVFAVDSPDNAVWPDSICLSFPESICLSFPEMSFQRVPLLLPWEPVEVRTTTFLSYVRISALVRFGSRRTEMGAYYFFFLL